MIKQTIRVYRLYILIITIKHHDNDTFLSDLFVKLKLLTLNTDLDLYW